ncbi:MAG: hemerythrin domain-containing protein [Desulfacinum sp.]|nr:hemerythrin domain-containing protein [Desulfacinum sp.]MBZ4658835.1 Hemerythrin cation binding domain protein [Desulfacinum sp.]
MKAIDELKGEHRGIERMLDILKVLSERIGRGANVPPGDLDGVLEFLKVFVDRCHHGKEEDYLFPALEAAGVTREGGPIGVMLAEHEQGRTLVAKLEEAAARLRARDFEAHSRVKEIANQYGELLRNHIRKEEDVLFRMAQSHVAPLQDNDLYQAFELLERERIGPGRHAAFHDLMERLEKEYLG